MKVVKKCSKCNKTKDSDDFRINKKSKDGLFCWCKDCEREYHNQWKLKYKDELKEYHREYMNERYNNDDEFRDKSLESNRKWYDENKDKISKEFKEKYYNDEEFRQKVLDNSKQWRETHKEEKSEYFKNWSEENFEKRTKYKKDWDKNNKDKRRKYARKQKSKRKRNLGYVELFDNPFSEEEVIEWHHVTDNYVVALPKDLHKLYLGNHHREMIEYIVNQIYRSE